MTFDPNDHGYVASRPIFDSFEGDKRHNVGNITARTRRPLSFGELRRLMETAPCGR